MTVNPTTPLPLEMGRISKRFGTLQALDNVSLSLAPGRVHGLLGENGAGKTTLMNILFGLIRPDAGQIFIQDREKSLTSPRRAIAAGLGMVHQHFMLAGPITVLDNLLLGDRRFGPVLNRRRTARQLAKMAEELGLTIDPAARVDELSVGQQQRVEILKALWHGARLLILDEPTAVLTPLETQQLFTAIDRLRQQGAGVVFISHKLGEVKQICDDLTVLRRGKVVWSGAATGVSSAEIARHMVGHDVALVSLERALIGEHDSQKTATPGAARIPKNEPTLALRLDRLTAKGLTDINLFLPRGQILGIAGVDGNGQQELAEVIVGLRPFASGAMQLLSHDAARLSFRQRRDMGVAHIPNDRKAEGLIGEMSIVQNVALKRFDRAPFSTAGWMHWRRAADLSRDLCQQFDVRAAGVQTTVGTLSGGNQQKVVLARELAIAPPRLIVAMNPVRGLDILATQFVYQQLLHHRQLGAAVLLISSELDELRALCDRVSVLYNGRLMESNFPAPHDNIATLMAGVPA